MVVGNYLFPLQPSPTVQDPTAETESTLAAVESSIVNYHFHNEEVWFGAKDGSNGVPAIQSLNPFTLTTGVSAGTFGTAVMVLNGTETPFRTGMTKFDCHRIQIAGLSQTGPYFWRIRVAYNLQGETTYDECIANGDYSEIVVCLTIPAIPFEMMFPRVPVGTKAWANVASSYSGTATINVFFGIHEYLQ